ncbi:unnamed protein product [Eruca vesicaria subsp. sativa]|uniref:Uncharacterized protein n=1 Tax=Eruca vesicaria subsp. sativa TaxID=29727 RepID=A0ABC8JMB1_ERUVS|nr:unnamed protein product [Eruca vesicaria subsp. sativa]
MILILLLSLLHDLVLIKLLGREDAKIGTIWKRVKPFRCGDFGDCIEKVEILQKLTVKRSNHLIVNKFNNAILADDKHLPMSFLPLPANYIQAYLYHLLPTIFTLSRP